MAENAVLKQVRDRTGAIRLLEMLQLDLKRALPLLSGNQRALLLDDKGFWVLSEVVGARPACSHSVEFIPFKSLVNVEATITDAARHSDHLVSRLEGVDVSLTHTESESGDPIRVEVEGDVVVQSAHDDNDAARLWGLISDLLRSCASANTPISVTATVP